MKPKLFPLFVYFLFLTFAAVSTALCAATSPFLDQAARDKVQWRPWNADTLALATNQKKPVYINIGALWCADCRRMDREIFANEVFAKDLNSKFIPIKLDRELRPDIDYRYQLVISAMEEVSGWPLNVMADGDGLPFWGSTFIPKTGHMMDPGFDSVLSDTVEKFTSEATEIKRVKQFWLQRALQQEPQKTPVLPFGKSLAEIILTKLKKDASAANVFGKTWDIRSLPPLPVTNILAYAAVEMGDGKARELSSALLNQALRSGMYDPIAGGFYRLRSSPKAYIPDFDKGLSTNAMALKSLSMSCLITGEIWTCSAADRTFRFLHEVLREPSSGAFNNAQLAATDTGHPGEYQGFSQEEIDVEIPLNDAALLKRVFDIRKKPLDLLDAPNTNVLHTAESFDAIAAELKLTPASLFSSLHTGLVLLEKLRAKKQTPPIEQLIVSSSNGLALDAISTYAVIRDSDAAKTAARALSQFLSTRAVDRKSNSVIHTFTSAGSAMTSIPSVLLLADYVHVATGLYEYGRLFGDTASILQAKAIVDAALRDFCDKSGTCRDNVLSPQERNLTLLQLPVFHWVDGAQPSTLANLALLLDRFSALSGIAPWSDKAGRLLASYLNHTLALGSAHPSYALAIRRHFDPPTLAIATSIPKDLASLQSLWYRLVVAPKTQQTAMQKLLSKELRVYLNNSGSKPTNLTKSAKGWTKQP